jgi:hypothetical protein
VKRKLVALVAGAAALAAGAASAVQAADTVSSNWAGYAVAPSDLVDTEGNVESSTSTATTFTRVSGTWVQPAAACTASTPTYSAFWVGLGGYAADSQALEQVGTEADCSSRGTPTYSVWYEIVPAPPVNVKLKLAPGNTVTASVQVTGTTVTLKLSNLTRHTTFTKRVQVANPDLSSAEWIAEAPSACTAFGRCETLPLANFGSVVFKNAYATANGHAGAIADPAWTAVSVDLRSDTGFGRSRFIVGDTPTYGATTASLSATGSSFAVAYDANATTPPGQTPQPDPGAGGTAP